MARKPIGAPRPPAVTSLRIAVTTRTCPTAFQCDVNPAWAKAYRLRRDGRSSVISRAKASDNSERRFLCKPDRWLAGTPPVEIAAVYTALGDSDHAFQWLNRAVEDRASGLVYRKIARAYDPLRGDPRFVQLLQQIHLN